jgi:hypothetical protein
MHETKSHEQCLVLLRLCVEAVDEVSNIYNGQ